MTSCFPRVKFNPHATEEPCKARQFIQLGATTGDGVQDPFVKFAEFMLGPAWHDIIHFGLTCRSATAAACHAHQSH